MFFMAIIAVLFLHSFTHLGQSFLLRLITPGAVTSVVVCIPYSLYVYHRLFQANLIDGAFLGWSVLWGGLIVPMAHSIGKKLVRA
jgi:hypothetical protein